MHFRKLTYTGLNTQYIIIIVSLIIPIQFRLLCTPKHCSSDEGSYIAAPRISSVLDSGVFWGLQLGFRVSCPETAEAPKH